MFTNNSGKWYFATPVGGLYVGNDPPPPDGSTVLVAPGGTLPADLAKRYKVTEKMMAPPDAGKAGVPRDAAGEPIVVKDGKSYAAGVLPDDDEGKQAAMKAAGEEDASKEDDDDDADAADEPGVKVKKAADAESKAVRPGRDDVEDKAVHAPPQAKRAPTKPGAKGK